MTEKDLLSALSDVDEGYIEHAAAALEGRKKPRVLRAVIALAAALCLVIAGTVGAALSSTDTTVSYPANHTISPDTITGKQYVQIGNHSNQTNISGSIEEVSSVYKKHIVISARVIEVLPDTYRLRINIDLQYHILHLAVNEAITGTNVPHEIYYLLPAELSTDLTEYTDIIIAVNQIGRDDYLMYNQTQSRMEAFTLLFATAGEITYNPANGPIIPFKDGAVDESLWEKEGWKQYESFMRNRLNAESCQNHLSGFPACKGCTLENVKKNIRAMSDDSVKRVYTIADFTSDAAKKAIAYTKPFVNGTFQHSSYEDSLTYTRLINGFVTGETIRINSQTGEVIYSDEKYTAEDLRKVPDLGALIERLSGEKLTPPTSNENEEKLLRLRISGWYRKADSKVYGIVKVEWVCRVIVEDSRYDTYEPYQIAAYYLASQDGTYREIDREELLSIIGEDYRLND